MRKNTLFLLSFCTLTALVSCLGNDRSKPLMAGIKEAYNAVQKEKATSAETETSDNEGFSPVTKTEIPAPLTDRKEQILKREGYTVSYNRETLQPNWVAWCLYAGRCSGPAKRPQRAFHEDTDVQEPRAVDADYYNSGFDRGHMCPAADNKWNVEAMFQSFLFTNICPQNHSLNIGDWNEMENQCRRWAAQYDNIYIVCGPIFYDKKHKTIGRNRIPVPEAFFKVVLRLGRNPQAIGFIYKNTGGNRPKGDYVNTVDEVERITGIDFFPSLPDSVEKVVEATADLDNWQ